MNTLSEPFFSWTSRRIDLTAVENAPTLPAELDESLRCGTRKARLLAIRDSENETEYVALLVGDVSGRSDVTVREVDEELLLVEAGRVSAEPEILLGVAPGRTSGLSGAGHVDREVLEDGPVRSLIIRSGARSVVVDWYHGSRPSSSPVERADGRDAVTGRSGVDESYRDIHPHEPGGARTAPQPMSIRWMRRLLPALRSFGSRMGIEEHSRAGSVPMRTAHGPG